MKYLNVQLLGLSGRPHPALLDVVTTQDVKKLRAHIKFLAGDFFTAERRALDQPGTSSSCALCRTPVESVAHIMVQCRAIADVHSRMLPELLNTVAQVQPTCQIHCNPTPDELTQFLLDCTSINLRDNLRIPSHNPDMRKVFLVSRDWCFAVTNERKRLLQKLKMTV